MKILRLPAPHSDENSLRHQRHTITRENNRCTTAAFSENHLRERPLLHSCDIRDPRRSVLPRCGIRDPRRRLLHRCGIRDPRRSLLHGCSIRDRRRSLLHRCGIRDPPTSESAFSSQWHQRSTEQLRHQKLSKNENRCGINDLSNMKKTCFSIDAALLSRSDQLMSELAVVRNSKSNRYPFVVLVKHHRSLTVMF